MKYIPAHHRREYNVSGPNQASFSCKFKATRNKLGQKRHSYCVPKIFCAMDIL